MKPAAFRYLRPTSIEAAVEGLQAYGEDAKPLAGGQSLLPMMNFRLARPTVLVDLERVAGLDHIELGQDTFEIGAMARQAQVVRSAQIRQHLPILSAALAHVGHHQIRTRGTIGGSMAHADPAAELPAIALLLGAEMRATGPRGTRAIAAAQFFQAPFTTDLEADEVLTAVRFPVGHVEHWAFEELARRGGDFAIAGVAVASTPDGVRLVAFGLGWVPSRLRAAEAVLANEGFSDAGIAAAAAAARDEVEPMSDIHADSEYRAAAIETLVERALRSMHR